MVGAVCGRELAECKEDRCPVSEIVTRFGGVALSWPSKTQACVTLSSAEAECVALADCAKDVLYLEMLLKFSRPE